MTVQAPAPTSPPEVVRDPGRATPRDRDRRKRHDGSEIDPSKSLAEFVESFPATGAVETEPAPPTSAAQPPAPVVAAPSPAAVVAAPTTAPVLDDPEFQGKTPQEIIAIAKAERERATAAQRDLDAQKTQAQIDAAARRAVQENQPRPAPQPPAPKVEDPRWAQVDDLWFTDPPKARQIMKQIQDEEFQGKLQTERQNVKQEVFTELTEKQRAAQADYAYKTAVQQIVNAGGQITRDKITAVYTIISRNPTAENPNPYYDAGSLLNPDVVVKAYKDLFGLGQSTTQTPAPQAPAPVIVPPTPPGSGRPAPAASAPSSGRAAPIGADQKRDIEHMAEAFGYDKEKMLNRRRARLAREQENR